MKYRYTSILLILLLMGSTLLARGFRVNQIPNGIENNCAGCHVNPAGGGARNAFGQMVGSSFLDGSGNVIWNAQLAAADADGDGFSNGQELQDPFGLWSMGLDAPGDAALVGNPGDDSSSPVGEGQMPSLLVQLTGMDPHVGQYLEMRIIDLVQSREIQRTIVNSIPSADFDLEFLNSLEENGDYRIEFFADHNGNQIYDPPGTDHTWSLDPMDVAGDQTLAFQHNTNFTALDWTNLLTLQFAGMAPHIGESLHIRIVDDSNQSEAARYLMETVSGEAFELSIPGLMQGASYHMDLFADHNNDGLYAPPPTDHAWREALGQVDGNMTYTFTHNTSFTDISWPYQAVLSFQAMNPHVGELLAARLVEAGSGVEIDRFQFNEVANDAFTIPFTGIQEGVEYLIDIFADHNGNGSYDAPPTDHAWRVSFTAGSGDTDLTFTHNTDFVDIEWPGVVGVDTVATLPAQLILEQNYPNPFNPQTVIGFTLAETGQISLEIYDLKGDLVQSLANGLFPAGHHQLTWTPGNTSTIPAAGMYLYRLSTTTGVQSGRMLYLK